MVKELPLSNGGVALVDDDVYEWAKQYTWRLGGSDHRQYVERTAQIGHGARGRRVVHSYLHREIMQSPKGIKVDHHNRNPLDNRRENLRLATRSQQLQNRQDPPSKTGVRGVSWAPRYGAHEARIWKLGKAIYVGRFDSLEEAERAVKAARQQAYTHAPENDEPPISPPPRVRRYVRKSNTGIKGISWCERPGRVRKYEVSICRDTRVFHVGSFTTLEEAIAARKAAEEKGHHHETTPLGL